MTYPHSLRPQVKMRTADGGRISIPAVDDLDNLCDLPYYDDVVFLDVSYGGYVHLPFELPGHLQVLQCSHNRLTALPANLPSSLHTLYANANRISAFPNVAESLNLVILDLSSNSIESVSDVTLPPDLKVLHLSDNIISRFSVSAWPTHLVELDLSINRLTVLDESLDRLNETCQVSLTRNDFPSMKHNAHAIWLDAQSQDPASIKTAAMVTRLRRFGIRVCVRASLPIDQGPDRQPEIRRGTQRAIDATMDEILAIDRRPVVKSIFNDKHNVHASSIQKSANASVAWLLSQVKDDSKSTLSQMERISQDITALQRAWRPRRIYHVLQWLETWEADDCVKRHCSDETIHSAHGLAYNELLSLIWRAIQSHPARTEILSVLKQEIIDGKWVCFTGRFTRALNALTGFIDEVTIGISSTEQVSNRVVAALKRVSLKHKEGTKEYESEGRKEVAEILEEAGIPQDQHGAWLDAV